MKLIHEGDQLKRHIKHLLLRIVEIMTCVQPLWGRSIEETYQTFVIKQENPHIPSGLPPEVENVPNGCFEYDLRNRPLTVNILQAFER